MRQVALVFTTVFALGLLVAVPDYAEDPVPDAGVLQLASDAPQCEAPEVDPALLEVLRLGEGQLTQSIRVCTAEESSTCPTGCGCLVVGSGPCCIGLAAHCALTCP